MANILIFFTSLILSVINPSDTMKKDFQKHDVTTFYLIRHAEKDRSVAGERDPELSTEGKARAQKWADILKDIEFDAIYSTDFNRTRQTVQHLADLNQLEIQSYDPRNLYSEAIRKTTTGKTILVVGHSNTTPHFANAILGERKYEDIDDAENGALFIVQVQPDGSAQSQLLYIN